MVGSREVNSLRIASAAKCAPSALLVTMCSIVTAYTCIAQNAVGTRHEVARQEQAVHPRMYFEDKSRLGHPFAKDPSVIQYKDAFYMYYSLPPGRAPFVTDPRKMVWGIGVAMSKNLYDWKKVGEILPEQAPELAGIAAPGARVIAGKVELFYQTYNPADYRSSAICHAISLDGVHFTRDSSNPVYKPDDMAWTAGRAIDAEVFIEGDKLRMYFATRDPGMKVQIIGLAEAPLHSSFGRGTWLSVSKYSPVLKPQLPWEGDCIEAPTVVERKGELFMFYAGNYNNHPQQIGVARSSDGLHWQRVSAFPALANGAPGSWNSSESGHPGALRVGDRYYIFYQGNNDSGTSYYLSMVPVEWADNTPVLSPDAGR